MMCTDETGAPGIEAVPALGGFEVGWIAAPPVPGVLSETAVALRSWMPRGAVWVQSIISGTTRCNGQGPDGSLKRLCISAWTRV